MTWAMGSGWATPGSSAFFPQLHAALTASPPDFAAAAPPQSLGHFTGIGIQQRLAKNNQLWFNAEAVIKNHLDPETLYWPNPAPIGVLGTMKSWAPLLTLGVGLGAAFHFRDALLLAARNAWRAVA